MYYVLEHIHADERVNYYRVLDMLFYDADESETIKKYDRLDFTVVEIANKVSIDDYMRHENIIIL